jgi:cell shape-determining protein MreC
MGERVIKLETGIEGLRDTLKDVQHDVRGLAQKLDTFADLRHTQEGNRETINEMKETLDGMSANIERCFNEIESDSAKKWAEHDRDYQETKQKLQFWHGVLFSVVLVGGSLIGGFVYFLNYRFNEQSDNQRQAETDIRENRDRIDAMKDKQHALELFQARQSNTTIVQPGG